MKLCVFNNSADEPCVGKMHIVFPKNLSKSQIVKLSQKGNIDNDENGTHIDNDDNGTYLTCPICKNSIPISLEDLQREGGVTCPHCGLFLSLRFN